jgi:Uma2 family endonuclease
MTSVQTKARFSEQSITCGGISWEQFTKIHEAFDGIGGLRLIYCEGVLEIVPISKTHELICYLLGLLLGLYFTQKKIRFFPSGAYTQRVEGLAEFQSDLSFSFGADKDVPDLCIEVVLSSGGMDKLRKYQLRGVPEVWFWQDNQITVYCLVEGQYQLWGNSRLLPDLDLGFLCECLGQDSPLSASLMFAERYK